MNRLGLCVLLLLTAGRLIPVASADSVTLAWTAPGDDGNTGTATAYDVRYSTAPITAGNFASAVRWTAVMSPRIAGSQDTTRITGLAPATTYYFALKAADEAGNVSGISNVVGWTTGGAPVDSLAPSAATGLHVKP